MIHRSEQFAGTIQRAVALFVLVWLSVLSPTVALAQEAADSPSASEAEAPTVESSEPEVCSGNGCGQGANQGANQGSNQGGLSAEDLGATQDENGDWVFPEGTNDTRQGSAQGTGNGTTATNSTTGSGSTNGINSDIDNTHTTNVTNTAHDTTTATATGNTGGNAVNDNTSNVATTTGSASIGVTSVKNDNTAVIGGSAGLDVSGYAGTYLGDLLIGFGLSAADLSDGKSVRAINDTTGSDSTNTIDLNSHVEEINEVQNDGRILNDLVLAAITGQNESSKNTGDATIATGDADIAATLVNLLNTTVVNGSLMISVADIFGDLVGNITLPQLAALAASFFPSSPPQIVVGNENTGSDSTNTIDVDVTNTETTGVTNDAVITTTVEAEAITGQNEAVANTGGGFVNTGDASVSASNISLANTTIEGGNWGLVIVNALNRWLGFLVGENGEVRALSQEETIEAVNQNTGSDSTNSIAVTDERERETTVTNTAEIENRVDAQAITGQNLANRNTGAGTIETGDATIAATAVNIANTTVKDGSLFIAVVNIFGDWFGDLLYGGSSLLAAAPPSHNASAGEAAQIDASNHNTGSESENTIDVTVDRSYETEVDNDATITTNLNATIDTGTNRTNRNTLGGNIDTGDGALALHARSLANLTGIALSPALGLTISGLNDTTGFDSENRISAELNDERIISVDNFADIDTLFASLVNTGNNEANQNTIGGSIDTGNIDANVGVNNLVNRVILALWGGAAPGTSWGAGHGFAFGEQVVIDADFLNRLTGALSENSNEADANYTLGVDIDNVALIDTLLDLIFTTGGNTANENTWGAAVVTGRICMKGDVNNSANNNVLGLAAAAAAENGAATNAQFGNNTTGSDSVNENELRSETVQETTAVNQATVNNNARVAATTGDNEVNDNTSVAGEGDDDDCPIALAAPPLPTPGAVTPSPFAEGGPEPEDGEGGEDVGQEEVAAAPRVAGVHEGGAQEQEQKAAAPTRNQLRRFPVAGGEDGALLLASRKSSRWIVFTLLGALAVGLAYALDRRRVARP